MSEKYESSAWLLGGQFTEKNMVNLEQIVTKCFSTVFISIGYAEQHSKNLRKSNIKK